MGIKTGRPRGRPKGAKNKRAVGGAFEGDALAYLTSIYKDLAKPENVRMDAAKAAICYERAALTPVEQAPQTDFVPLAEWLRPYVGTDAWERRPARRPVWEETDLEEEPSLTNVAVRQPRGIVRDDLLVPRGRHPRPVPGTLPSKGPPVPPALIKRGVFD
jgi:hypothetical protein